MNVMMGEVNMMMAEVSNPRETWLQCFLVFVLQYCCLNY